jgi:hypothetical protein
MKKERCIEMIAISGALLSPAPKAASPPFVSGTDGAFDRYYRCIEIGNLGCIAFSRIRGRIRRLSSPVLVAISTAMTDA